MHKGSANVMMSRWAVEVEGHAATIHRLETYLNESISQPSDTFISRLRDIAVIRSRLWDKVNDPDLVGQFAQTELALLQGLTKLAGGASPLSTGTIFELGLDDTITQQTRTSVNSVYVLSLDGDTSPVFRQRLDVIREHDALTGVVIELSGRPDWITIYKAIEYIEDHFGGEKQLYDAFPLKKSALKRIKRTSNSMRHRARAFANIDNPYKLEDAEKFLQSLIKDVISSINSSSAQPYCAAYLVPKREYPPEQVVGLKPLILVNGEQSEVAFVGDTLTVD